MPQTNGDMAAKVKLKCEDPPTVTLHKSGDVTIIGSEKEQSVVVSSSVLRHTSQVWRAMFNDRWTESTSTEIRLPDDNADTMRVVL
ncbi:hypothetical protein BCR34DRAFT_561764 [Clohesyomyces aquaticus]|uniref:BTB domain-containing protein n=1 Tax=Clohesyomyces aquaticus TaxID=1231657 RepID=A0A1Y1ZTM9_9PLEO|nr:hypothetical protein BCR34DRAFT_561764 [Clohesyomyces aquaticus]